MSSSDLATLLTRVPIFAALPPDVFGQLAEIAVERSYDDGATIFREGDPGDAWYVVVDGAVRIVRELDDGGTLVLTELAPGSSFGEIAVFDDLPRSAGAIAEGPTRLIEIRRGALQALLADRPAVLARLLVAVIANLSSAVRRVTQNLVTVYETGKLAGTVRDPALLAREVLERLHGALGADRSAIGLWNPYAESYEWLTVGESGEGEEAGAGPLDAEHPFIAAAFEAGEAVILERAADGAGADRESGGAAPWLGAATIVVPLVHDGEGLGVLVFATDREGAFGDDQQKLAGATALQVAGALALARHERDERDRERLERSRARGAS